MGIKKAKTYNFFILFLFRLIKNKDTVKYYFRFKMKTDIYHMTASERL